MLGFKVICAQTQRTIGANPPSEWPCRREEAELPGSGAEHANLPLWMNAVYSTPSRFGDWSLPRAELWAEPGVKREPHLASIPSAHIPASPGGPGKLFLSSAGFVCRAVPSGSHSKNQNWCSLLSLAWLSTLRFCRDTGWQDGRLTRGRNWFSLYGKRKKSGDWRLCTPVPAFLGAAGFAEEIWRWICTCAELWGWRDPRNDWFQQGCRASLGPFWCHSPAPNLVCAAGAGRRGKNKNWSRISQTLLGVRWEALSSMEFVSSEKEVAAGMGCGCCLEKMLQSNFFFLNFFLYILLHNN